MSDTPTKKKALIVWGGWPGHTPKESAEVCATALTDHGYDVTVKDTLDAYLDESLMGSLDLIIPIWTMGEISGEQWGALNHAVQSGVGLAGFHGGMIDAFRKNTEYQWMTGAQWVAHPGGCIERYRVYISDDAHPITAGLDDFDLLNTEQYYCHTDPGNNILCHTIFDQGHENPSLYTQGAVMPYAYTKTWGKARVFCAMWGHTDKDFDIEEAKEIVVRGMQWATK
ncbi:MAG: ThuA domain-containing protein [Planctomycetota bacterium]